MRKFIAFLLVVSLSACGPVAAQDDAWSDEDIWQNAVETYGASRFLRDRVFENTEVQTEIERVGVSSACELIDSYIDEQMTEIAPEFRPLLVAEVRSMFPDTADRRDLWTVSSLGPRFEELMKRVRKKSPDFFATLATTVDDTLLPKLRNGSNAGQEWRYPVSDWDFEGRNDLVWSNACAVAMSADPAASKKLFDAFYTLGPQK